MKKASTTVSIRKVPMKKIIAEMLRRKKKVQALLRKKRNLAIRMKNLENKIKNLGGN